MTQIIGIAGAAGAGKSFLAQMLCHKFGFTRFAFADPLKDMLRVLLMDYGYTREQTVRWIEGDWKEVACPALHGQTCRYALQTLGTEWGRNLVHNRLWTNLLVARIEGTPLVVVDDVRMDNEAEALLQYEPGAVIYRVVPTFAPSRHPGEHASELGINRALITADIVHDFTAKSMEEQVMSKIAAPLNLREIPYRGTRTNP